MKTFSVSGFQIQYSGHEIFQIQKYEEIQIMLSSTFTFEWCELLDLFQIETVQ